MPLFRRIADIVSANLNEMVDRFENPEKMLRQAVREMERAVGAALDRAVAAVAHEKLLARQVAEHRRQAELWRRRAVAAVRADDDPLARRAIARRLEYERLVASLESQEATASDVSRSLQRQIETMRSKLAEAKRKLATTSARRHIAQARIQVLSAAPHAGGVAGLSRFDRWMNQVEFSEAHAEAWCELAGDADQDLDAIDETTLDHELAILKESMDK